MAGFATVMLMGCGEKDAALSDPTAIAFLTDYYDIDFGGGIAQQAVVHEGFLYVYMGELFAGGERNDRIVKVSLADGAYETITLFALGQNQRISGMAVQPQGGLLFLIHEWADDGAYSYTLCATEADGQKIWEKDIKAAFGLGNDAFPAMYSDGQGNLYFAAYAGGNEHQFIKTDSEANVQATLTLKQNGGFQGIVCTADGEVYISVYDNINARILVKKADFAAGEFGPDIELKGLEQAYYLYLANGGTTGVWGYDQNSLYECDLKKGRAAKLLAWSDCAINAEEIVGLGQTSDGLLWVLNSRHDGGGTELLTLTQMTYGELPPRETVTYGTLYLDYDVRAAVTAFNKKNQQYQIRIVEYGGEEEYGERPLRFQLDIASGNCPDIIDLAGINFPQLAAKGVFADLNPYLDQSGIERGEYLENALNAYEIEGKLYGIMTSFSVNALVGHASKLEGNERWNVAEMMAWAERYPGAKLMNSSSLELVAMMVAADLGNFIDWNSGAVAFASNDFIRLLEFARVYGYEKSLRDEADNPERLDPYGSIASGKQLLTEEYISEISDLQFLDAFFDGEPQFVGFPSTTGSGIAFATGGNSLRSYALAANSPHKEGAFAFLEFLLSDDYQNGEAINSRHGGRIPVKLSAIEAMLLAEAAPHENDINNGAESPNGGRAVGDFAVPYYASRNADYVDDFYALLARAEGVRSSSDRAVIAIIEEEAAAYFAGLKSVEEVAGVVQNRVQLYVNENR
ncbi:MAG: extracellular solute-binding protein [Lachnospiraceae bacterium]|nr:extracellular solute-binding protein [Lachnospiraceae bacterium]